MVYPTSPTERFELETRFEPSKPHFGLYVWNIPFHFHIRKGILFIFAESLGKCCMLVNNTNNNSICFIVSKTITMVLYIKYSKIIHNYCINKVCVLLIKKIFKNINLNS